MFKVLSPYKMTALKSKTKFGNGKSPECLMYHK